MRRVGLEVDDEVIWTFALMIYLGSEILSSSFPIAHFVLFFAGPDVCLPT
jgi:hypothetical protein